MKKRNFLAAVAATSRKAEAEIAAIYNNGGMRKLMDEIILPIIVRPTGQDIRGWRIGDDFMSLMAKHGNFIAEVSGSCYDILAEIAMQRLSCGAVLHEPTPIFEALPSEYHKYSCAGDQPGLMSGSCWDFYRDNAKVMLERPRLHDHAAKIARGILTHSDEDGSAIGDYMWGSHCEVSLKEARQFCMELLDDMVDETFEHITAYNWHQFIPFLKKHQEKINWKSFDMVDEIITADNWNQFIPFLKKHQEKMNWKRFFQKLGVSGLFQGKERRAIKKAIIG